MSVGSRTALSCFILKVSHDLIALELPYVGQPWESVLLQDAVYVPIDSTLSMSQHLGKLQSSQMGNSNRLMCLGERCLSEGSKMSESPFEDLQIYD